MDFCYCHERVVQREDLDDLGHASNVAYVAWMQEAAIAHSTAREWSPERYRASGTGWVVRRHEIEYHSPALKADRLLIYTWVATMEKVTSLRRYEFRHADTHRLLAQASTEWVYVNLARQRPTRIPPELRSAFVVDPRTSVVAPSP